MPYRSNGVRFLHGGGLTAADFPGPVAYPEACCPSAPVDLLRSRGPEVGASRSAPPGPSAVSGAKGSGPAGRPGHDSRVQPGVRRRLVLEWTGGRELREIRHPRARARQ